MNLDQIASILWRRKLAFLLTVVLCVAAVVGATLSLDKTYSATATLFVGGSGKGGAFIDTGLLEQNTRTYSTLASNPNIARIVIEATGLAYEPEELLARMAFAPVERTQLLLVSADGSSPAEAQQIANAYATTFADRMMSLFRQGKTPAEIAVSQPATLPTSPAKPNPPLYIGLGTLLALLLGLGIALLRERVDTRIRVAPEHDTVLDQPIVARIPRLAGRTSVLSREIADRFGLLKTNLDFFDESPSRVVLVTSPGVSEGKSTVSANLAVACAHDGERVVLIEADLRRPGLDGTIVAERMERSAVGLSNYLAGGATESEIINSDPDHPGLYVIWSGIIPPNPTALLGSHRLDSLIASLRLDFDRLIIDTCPISVGADASVIASRVDGTLFIVDERKTRRPEAQAGLNQLRGVRARLLGVVLNRATVTGGEGYYYAPDQDKEETKRVADPDEAEAF